jgi:hypothetical protein
MMHGGRDRQVTFFTGAIATERLSGIDEQSMPLTYTLTDGPLHAEHRASSAQVVPHGARPCRFVWTIDILPNPLAGRVAELTKPGSGPSAPPS